jgi:DNA-binding beta-propeller fold protein YncE
VTELSAVGAPLSPAGGFTDASLNQPSNVAIDVSGNAWTANNGASTVTVFTGGGALLAGAPFTVGNGPSNLAVDASGTVWVINSMDLDVSRLTGSGANVLGSPYTSNVLSQPIGIAALSAGYVAVTNAAADTLSLYDNTGAMPAGPFGGNGLSAPYGLAIDAGGDAWIADNSQVTEFTGLGGLAAGSPFSPPASPIPTAVAIDGAGNAWITEVANDSLIEMSNAGAVLSGATGIEPNPAVVPEAVAVDGSGNVWYSSTNQGALYELVGAAVPVVTPLAYGVQNNLLGQQP